jgi:hypothetical protein
MKHESDKNEIDMPKKKPAANYIFVTTRVTFIVLSSTYIF